MPRFHVYTEARHPTGAVAAGHNLTVYDDAAGTVTSSIYAAASGGSPLANPYVVPATGVIDFWATVPKPYVESGDSVKQPLPIVVATPADIGAANLSTPNTFSGNVSLNGGAGTAAQLLIQGGDNAQNVDNVLIDAVGPAGTSSVTFTRDGAAEAGLFLDAYSVGIMSRKTHQDRINIGIDGPNTVQIGATNATTANIAGWPFMLMNGPGAGETGFNAAADLLRVTHDPAWTGRLFVIEDQNANGIPQTGLLSNPKFYVTAVGDVYEHGNIVPIHGNASTVGDMAHGYKDMVLSDGTDTWRVTVDASGVLHTAKAYARKNLCTNPSFQSLWPVTSDVAGSIPSSLVAGRISGNAQRVQYTGVSGDSSGAKTISLLVPGSLVVGSAAPGDVLAVPFYYKGAISGVTFYPYVQWKKSDGSAISTVYGTTLTPTGSWQRSAQVLPAAPALTSYGIVRIAVGDIGTGDTVDITLDDCLYEKSGSIGSYFDGATTNCMWEGDPNASTSVAP